MFSFYFLDSKESFCPLYFLSRRLRPSHPESAEENRFSPFFSAVLSCFPLSLSWASAAHPKRGPMSVLGQLLLSLYPSPQKKDNKKNPYFPLTLKEYLTECL